jgi:hypothetical protein
MPFSVLETFFSGFFLVFIQFSVQMQPSLTLDVLFAGAPLSLSMVLPALFSL